MPLHTEPPLPGTPPLLDNSNSSNFRYWLLQGASLVYHIPPDHSGTCGLIDFLPAFSFLKIREWIIFTYSNNVQRRFYGKCGLNEAMNKVTESDSKGLSITDSWVAPLYWAHIVLKLHESFSSYCVWCRLFLWQGGCGHLSTDKCTYPAYFQAWKPSSQSSPWYPLFLIWTFFLLNINSQHAY